MKSKRTFKILTRVSGGVIMIAGFIVFAFAWIWGIFIVCIGVFVIDFSK